MNLAQISLAEAEAKKETAKNARKAASQSGHRIYLIIVGLAATQALTQTFTGQGGLLGTKFGEPAHPTQLLLLLALASTAMRFAHECSILRLLELTGAYKWQRVNGLVLLLAKSVPTVRVFFRAAFSFRGRLNRRPFWFAILLVGGLTQVSIMMLEKAVGTPVVVLLLCITVIGIWSCIALQAKRWHDIGLSGRFLLLNLIPIVGQFATLIIIGFRRGTAGNNRFGPDPLGHY